MMRLKGPKKIYANTLGNVSVAAAIAFSSGTLAVGINCTGNVDTTPEAPTIPTVWLLHCRNKAKPTSATHQYL